ncbi:uncharacterized protein C22orf15 homolog [Mirounga leonina]|uniref:uncharacterized protein C22orf15 homolog n=1 Tax=Mirounga leonina TaxID=9715 RepID=UPI00156C1ED2|nr:uncharacterized protein C22orf15 homolog [Mirounga leonina]XP_045742371.1 uncharacterized protein C22orf15 homolog [Mirounga angustirostris]
MFIKVMFGAGCWELVNTWCSPVTLTAHLRQRGQVPPDAVIALLAEDGHFVSLDEGLEEGASQAPSMGSALLQERGTYVLVQIISKWATEGEGGAPTRYESLLENLDDQYPELAGEPKQQPRGILLAESGLTEKLHQPEGQGHRPDVRPPRGAPQDVGAEKGIQRQRQGG